MNIQKMMKQVQKMQGEMARVQEELGNLTVEGTAGGGVVKAVVSGHKEVKAISIDPSVIDPEDQEMLQDLVMAAVNDGLRKADEMANEELGKVTGKMQIPGMPPGLF